MVYGENRHDDPQRPERIRTGQEFDEFGRRFAQLLREMIGSLGDTVDQQMLGQDLDPSTTELPELASFDGEDLVSQAESHDFRDEDAPQAQPAPELLSVEDQFSIESDPTAGIPEITDGATLDSTTGPPVEFQEVSPTELSALPGLPALEAPVLDSVIFDEFDAPELPNVGAAQGLVTNGSVPVPAFFDFDSSEIPQPTSPSPLPEPEQTIDEQLEAALSLQFNPVPVPPPPLESDLPDALASPISPEDPVGFGALTEQMQRERTAYDPRLHQVQEATAERDRLTAQVMDTTLQGIYRTMQDISNLHQRARAVTSSYEQHIENFSDANI